MVDMFEEMDGNDNDEKQEGREEFQLAWMRVEEWRARLRMSGDTVKIERDTWDIVKSRTVYIRR